MILSNDEYEELCRLLHTTRISTLQASIVLKVVREIRALENKVSDLEVEKHIALSDRDNRRYRMDLAMAILDETQLHDLDAISSIVRRRSDRPYITGTPTPVVSDPTQVPTQWDCLSLGHVWGEEKTDGTGIGWHTCLKCKDERIL